MATTTEPAAESRPDTRARRVLMASFGALTMLILQFALGAAYAHWGTAPTNSKSVGMFSSPLLAIHVVLGILIIIAAIMLVVRAIQAKELPAVVTSIVGLLAVAGAFASGESFIGNGNGGTSFYMALTTAVAMLCYGANLVILSGKRS
jgi:heme A synthase